MDWFERLTRLSREQLCRLERQDQGGGRLTRRRLAAATPASSREAVGSLSWGYPLLRTKVAIDLELLAFFEVCDRL